MIQNVGLSALKLVVRNVKPLYILNSYLFSGKDPVVYYGMRGKFIFIRLHKVGGTSVSEALGIRKSHYTTQEAIKMVGRYNWERCYTFAFVRNPFTKVVSAYNYFTLKNRQSMADKPISFDDWVRKTYGDDKDPFYYYSARWFQSQSDWLKDKRGVISLNKIGKLENIKEDFAEISSKIGVSAPIPHLNKSGKADYRKFYTEASYEAVKTWHQEDLDNFGYTFDNG